MLYLTVAASLAAVGGLLYLAFFGSRSIPELFEKRRKDRSPEPNGAPAPSLNLEDLGQQLKKMRISAAPDLDSLDVEQLGRLGNPKLIVGNVILDGEFLSFSGISPKKVRVNWNPKVSPRVPDYVVEARREIEEGPKQDRPRNTFKVFLDKWRPPIIDDGNFAELVTCKSDWWMRKAFNANVDRLQSDILEGSIDLSNFPRPLDTDAVVITSDDQLVLVHRGDAVTYQPKTWSIPGEQMDAEKDFDARTNAVNPGKTIERILTETDELNLPQAVGDSAEIKFIALATEWDRLLANLIAMVRLPHTTSSTLRDCFLKGEHLAISFVDFRHDQIDRCVRLVLDGATMIIPGSSKSARLNDITRFSILAALFSKFGYLPMKERISRHSKS